MNVIDRRNKITIEEFQQLYLLENKPVIITDGMESWDIKTMWTPDYFMNNYSDEEVQLYDDLFNLIDIITLSEYINQYFGQENLNNKIVPYIRWYTRLKNYDFTWANHFFDKVKSHWRLPYFLPSKNYLLPYNFNIEELDPNKDMFPAKGLFISAKGARTKLHYDPWCSDAILCQIYGRKKVTMYKPSQRKFLCHGSEFVDIEKPDYDKFPNFNQAEPTFIDILNAEEIIFFPHNWLHHVNTIEDSISLTWNFVHISTWPAFFSYLISNPEIQDLEVIKFFLNKCNN
jgi:hypothetical protein